MSTTSVVFAAGIFAHESGQRFLQILLKLADRGFHGLYDKCADNLQGDYYRSGLGRVNCWPDSVLQEDVDFVKNDCPDIEDTFEDCFAQYVMDRFTKKRSLHACPPVLSFVRNFLESLGLHEYLISGQFFVSKEPWISRIACMDAARQAFYSLVTNENVRVELASEVGSVAPSTVHHSGRDDMRHRTRDDIRPDDSISQIGISEEPQKESHPLSLVEKRSRTPEKRSHTPEKRSRTPEKRSLTPEKRSRTPEKRSRTPEKRSRDGSSVASRHDFRDNESRHYDIPKRVGSSRDSHVSVQLKRQKSPKAD
jgi:hypothetical protein